MENGHKFNEYLFVDSSFNEYLFEGYNQLEWQEEWQDMPEFVQKEQRAYQEIIVRFDSEEEVKEFAAKLGRNITPNTKDIWYSLGKRYDDGLWKYIDCENEKE